MKFLLLFSILVWLHFISSCKSDSKSVECSTCFHPRIQSYHNFENQLEIKKSRDTVKWYHSEKYPYYDSIRFLGDMLSIKINPEHMIFYDTIDINGVKLYEDISIIYKKIGKPDSLVLGFDEICDRNDTLLYYSGNILTIMDNKLVGFNIINSKLKMKQLNISVGSHCAKIGKLYPKPCCGPKVRGDDDEEWISSGLFIKMENGLMSDDFLSIMLKNNKIIRIFYDTM
jgi:hypothetical protein